MRYQYEDRPRDKGVEQDIVRPVGPEQDHQRSIEKDLKQNMQRSTCWGYNPCFAAWDVATVQQGVANLTLSVLADVVLRIATRLKAPVIDLRRVMNKALVWGCFDVEVETGKDGNRWCNLDKVSRWFKCKGRIATGVAHDPCNIAVCIRFKSKSKDDNNHRQSTSFQLEVEDFANPIEPSSLGGAKFAAEIVKVVRTHPFESLCQFVKFAHVWIIFGFFLDNLCILLTFWPFLTAVAILRLCNDL